MNYDMVGSPNYIFMVYDADQSTFRAPEGIPIPAGSAAIEDLYESYYTAIGEPYDDTEFSGRRVLKERLLRRMPLASPTPRRTSTEHRRGRSGDRPRRYDHCTTALLRGLRPD
jgi:hypothetical protein